MSYTLTPFINAYRVLNIRGILDQGDWEDHLAEIGESQDYDAISFSEDRELVDTTLLNAVFQNPHVKIVEFGACEVNSLTLRDMFRQMQNLEVIEFTGTTFRDEEASIGVLQPNIRKLRLLLYEGNSHVVVDRVANAVRRSLRLRSSLKEIALWGLSNVSLVALAEALQPQFLLMPPSRLR